MAKKTKTVESTVIDEQEYTPLIAQNGQETAKPEQEASPKKNEIAEVATLSFFQCNELIREIQKAADTNDGELTEEQISALVEAQTTVPVKLKGLCNFIKLLEAKEAICKARIDEIKGQMNAAEDLRQRLCTPLAVWVEEQGKSYHVGEYTLKTRWSSRTIIPDGFNDPFFCNIEQITKVTPDRKAIKEALVSGESVGECRVEDKLNLIIK